MHEELADEALMRIANALETIRDLLADATRRTRAADHEAGDLGEYQTVKGGY